MPDIFLTVPTELILYLGTETRQIVTFHLVKVSVNALPNVVGFLRFPLTGKVDRVCWG